MTVLLLWSSDFLRKKKSSSKTQELLEFPNSGGPEKSEVQNSNTTAWDYWNWFGMIRCPRAHLFLLQTL